MFQKNDIKPKNMNKRRIENAIISAILGTIILFAFTFLLTKEWLVSEKLVVFPSGLASAQKNLNFEVGNTVEIINSPDFRENVFQDKNQNFLGATRLGNSSTVEISFLAKDNQVDAVKEVALYVPGEMSNYTHKLYSGDPFSYRLLEDPTISSRPVKPDRMAYAISGFVIGLLGYLLCSRKKVRK